MNGVTLPEVAVSGEAPAPPPPEAPAPQLIGHGGLAMVANADGTVDMVRPEDVPAAIAEGSRPATRDDWTRATMGKGGQVAAGLLGAARGATFGLSDPLLVEGSRIVGGQAEAEDTRQILRDAKSAYRKTSFGAEIAGSLAGMAILPGGAAKAVEGEGALTRAASRFVAAAPRAALEGAGMEVGHQASEDTLGPTEPTAEKYLAGAAHGVVFGGILGGGLHALGGAALDKARGFYGRGAEAAEGLATREGGAYRTSAKAAEGAAEAAGDDAESGVMAWLRKKANDTAEEKAFKATGATAKDFQKFGTTAEQQEGRARRIGRTLLDEGLVTGTASQEEIAKRVTSKLREVGEDLGAMRAKLDTAAARPSTEAIANRVMTEVLAPLERVPGTQTEAAAVRNYMADFIEKAGDHPSFETLHDFRRALGDKLDPKLFSKVAGSAQPGAVELGKVHRILEDEFTSAGERAANELGDTFATKYQTQKTLYSDLKTAEKVIVKKVAQGGANRSISLTDTIAGGAGAVAGAIVGGPVGALTSVASALGNKAMRSYGDQAAADLLNRASRLSFLQRSAETVDGTIKAGVKGFLSGERGAQRSSPEVTPAVVAAIREATRDPAALSAKVESMLSAHGIASAAPKVTQAASTTAMRIAAYLRDKAPSEPAPGGVSFIPQPPRAGSVIERETFAQAVEVANDPMSVVSDLQNGHLSREKIEGLKVCYPNLYQAIRAELAKQAVDIRPDLTSQQEMALSVLFDLPISAMMEPQNKRAFEQVFAQGADPSQTAQAGQPPTPSIRGLNRKGTLASGFDRSEEAPR